MDEDALYLDDILLSDMPDEYISSWSENYEETRTENNAEKINADTVDYSIQINRAISEMSKQNLQEGTIDKISTELSILYNKGVRNNYFALFSAISELSKGNIESFDALNANIDLLNEHVKSEFADNENVLMGFEKLNQYVKLEANRASYNQGQLEKIRATTEQFEKQKNELEKMEHRLKEYEDKLSIAESGYINNLLAVLGVFSGIIIAFFGGLEYISSVFNNIGDIGRYRLVFISLMLGFVIFNTVSVMLIFLGKMIDKDLYRRCKSLNCSCDKRCGFIKRIRNKLPYMYYINFFFIAIMLGTAGIWFLDLWF